MLYQTVFVTELTPVRGNKYSLGYERVLSRRHFTAGASVNWGYTPHSFGRGNLFGITDAVVRQGVFAFIDLKWFPFVKQRSGFRDPSPGGPFIGPYGSIMRLTEEHWTMWNSGQPRWTKISEYPIWVFGLGALLGYRQVLLKNFFIEGLCGFGYGLSDVASQNPGAGADSRSADTWRLEGNIGYCF